MKPCQRETDPAVKSQRAPAGTRRPETSASEATTLCKPAFSSASPFKRRSRPTPQASSHSTASRPGLAHAKSRRTFFRSPFPVGFDRPRHDLPLSRAGGVPFRGASRLWKAIPPGRNVPFCRLVLALSGGPSHRCAATRPGRGWVLLERNPPNRPLAPVGTPAPFERAIPLLKIKKELYALQIRSARTANQERRQRQAPGEEPPPAHIGTRPRTFTTPTALVVMICPWSRSWPRGRQRQKRRPPKVGKGRRKTTAEGCCQPVSPCYSPRQGIAELSNCNEFIADKVARLHSGERMRSSV